MPKAGVRAKPSDKETLWVPADAAHRVFFLTAAVIWLIEYKGRRAGEMLRLFTIGHSNYSFEEFLSLLKAFEICVVADVRRYPSSRKFQHFNGEVLSKLLDKESICYMWLEALGGRRHTGANYKSPNVGLRSLGFRNYADYMATREFRAAVEGLMSAAATSCTAVMCAEKLYWKCHRRLLSDYLVTQGIKVTHILGRDKLFDHKLTSPAVISRDGTVTYPSCTSDKAKAKELFDLDGTC